MRRLEIWKREPRARLTDPPLPDVVRRPRALLPLLPPPDRRRPADAQRQRAPFTRCTDQVPGRCRDYFAIDGWAHYAAPLGHWLWASRDAALVALRPSAGLGPADDQPQDAGRLLAMLFDNFWYTNFDGNSHGAMEFQCDLVWRETLRPEERAAVVDSLLVEPVVVVEPAMAEDAASAKRLLRDARLR